MNLKKIIFALCALNAVAAQSALIEGTGKTHLTNNTLYYTYPIAVGDSVDVTTTEAAKTAPLQGFGVYLNAADYRLDDAKVTTSGNLSDGVRFNGNSNVFFANTATIKALGAHADGINMGLINGVTTRYTNIAAIDGKADITGVGMGVRANNYAGAGSKSIIMLGDNSIVRSTTTGNASNASDGIGYGVYAGTTDVEQSGMGTMDRIQGKSHVIEGKSYVFIGDNSTISSAATNGHAVFSNQAGVIQLGDNADVTATGKGGYALYAESKKTASNGQTFRGATIYLEGGATLRADASLNVIQANGEGAVIKNASINRPVVDPLTYVRGTDIPIDTDDVTETSGRFDVVGNMSAINGGEISLNMDNNSIFIGSTSLDTNVDSTINLKISGNNSVWQMNKDSSLTSLTLEDDATLMPFRNSHDDVTNHTLTGNVANNSGRIDLSTDTMGQVDTFTINGNYSGNGGLIIFDTVLHDDTSETDHLIITGDTSGTTRVQIKNLGGFGEKTIDGIKIITVGGNSAGEFTAVGPIVAGAYDYFLNRADSNPNNWHLTNEYIPPVEEEVQVPRPLPPLEEDEVQVPRPLPPLEEDEVQVPRPLPPLEEDIVQVPQPLPPLEPPIIQPDPPLEPPIIQPDPPLDPPIIQPDPPLEPPIIQPDPPLEPPIIQPDPPVALPKPTQKKYIYRPEAGSYIANSFAVNNLFVMRLHDRLGETNYTESFPNDEKVANVWVRTAGGYNQFSESSGQLDTTGTRYILQVGGDITNWTTNDKDRYHLGVMGGYATNKSETESSVTGATSKGNVTGYSLGLYGTWYENEKNMEGWHTDVWAQYSMFDNDIQREGLAKEKYSSQGLTASVEVGYTFFLEDFSLQYEKYQKSNKKVYYIQPKAQITYMGVATDDHKEENGTLVISQGEGNIQTRVGIKLFANNFTTNNYKDTGRETQPFIEVNWLHNTEKFGVEMNGVKDDMKGASDIAEFKIGVEAKYDNNVTLWGSFAQQKGGSKYLDSKITVGAKYTF